MNQGRNRDAGIAATLALLVALFGAGAKTAAAQTAEQIVARHVKAMGGAKLLKSMAGTRLSGFVGGGGEFVWQTRTPAAYYLEVRQSGALEVEAFNGKSAWREDTKSGLRTLTGKEQARARAEGTYRSDRFLAYRKEKTRVSLVGREAVDGRPAHVIEVITATGLSRKVFFDAQTFLILKEEGERAGEGEEIFFSDYRPVDGVPEPHRIRIHRGAANLELEVQKATHNETVDATLFDFPRRDGAPLPDIATLLKQLEDSQKELEKAKADYAYTKTETDIEMDERGRAKEKSERTYEVFQADGAEMEKLVARNGQPLKDDEARKEQQRIEKMMRERKEAKRKRDAEGENAARKKEGDDELTISQLLRVCQFINPRRERFRGQEVVVFDFGPRAGARPNNRAESWMQKLSGNLWIDEHAKEIVRAEARVNEPIKMAGGFVLSLQRGASFVLEQELVKGEVWLPSYAEVSASARFLLVKGFKINQQVRYSDYKKFNVETSSEIKPVKE